MKGKLNSGLLGKVAECNLACNVPLFRRFLISGNACPLPLDLSKNLLDNIYFQG